VAVFDGQALGNSDDRLGRAFSSRLTPVAENNEWRMSESEAAMLVTSAYFIDQHGITLKSRLSAGVQPLQEIPSDPVAVYLSRLASGSGRWLKQFRRHQNTLRGT
jgi:hypothetical protein